MSKLKMVITTTIVKLDYMHTGIKLTAIGPRVRPEEEVYFSTDNQKYRDDICLEVTSTFPFLNLFLVKTVPKVWLGDLDDFYTGNQIAVSLIAFECLPP